MRIMNLVPFFYKKGILDTNFFKTYNSKFSFYLSFISICLFFSRASDYGLVEVDSRGRIVQFSEKPKIDDLKAMVSPIHE